jgi:opacity protein-like surface antigen
MKRAALFTLAAVLLAPVALAEEPFDVERGFYVAVRGYGSISDQNNIIFRDTREVAGALGYRINDSVRVEGEYGFRWSNIDGLNGASNATGNFTSRSLGTHVFYDFRPGHRFRPFLGAGGGAGVQDYEFSGQANVNPDFTVIVRDSNSSAYWNTFAGTTYHLTPRFRISAGVEYVTYTDQAVASNIGGIDGINRAYNFYVGARWFLGRTRD